MKSVFWPKLALATIFLFSYESATAQTETDDKKTANPITSDFPLIAGWQWQYNYLSEQELQTGKELVEIDGRQIRLERTKTTIELKIKTVLENNTMISAETIGNGLELSIGDQTVDDYCLVFHKPSGYLYLWPGPASAKKTSWGTDINPPKIHPLLIFPLKIGASWGRDAGVKSDSKMWQWNVEKEEEITVPAGTFKCFRLTYYTNPDHHLIWFCPGIGIVKQEYRHHGTIINVFMELISYGLKK